MTGNQIHSRNFPCISICPFQNKRIHYKQKQIPEPATKQKLLINFLHYNPKQINLCREDLIHKICHQIYFALTLNHQKQQYDFN